MLITGVIGTAISLEPGKIRVQSRILVVQVIAYRGAPLKEVSTVDLRNVFASLDLDQARTYDRLTKD